MMLGAAQRAVRESLSECARAEGKRGVVRLEVELSLGDGGDPLWVKGTLHFVQMLHTKDAG